jgi:hypothetical protein
VQKRILFAAAAGLAAVGVVGLAGVAGAAEYADPTGLIIAPATSYSSPSNQSGPIRSLSPGTGVRTVCFTEGQTLVGNHNWFRISEADGSGYVHRSAISVAPGLRHC